MGYEIIYSYHDKVDGDYNKEETKTIKKKVGDPFEDVPLEKLASSVMGQLARRDILVVGVEIFELAKRKISFREVSNGVVIKNKKFGFDQTTGSFVVQDTEPERSDHEPQTASAQGDRTVYPHEQIKKELTAKGEAPPSRKAIDYVVYVPEPQQIPEVARKGFKLTVDRKYPVFHRQQSMQGDVLTMTDDTNREIKISDKYFVPGKINLIADSELRFSETTKEREGGNLYWGGAVSDNVPNIRK